MGSNVLLVASVVFVYQIVVFYNGPSLKGLLAEGVS